MMMVVVAMADHVVAIVAGAGCFFVAGMNEIDADDGMID